MNMLPLLCFAPLIYLSVFLPMFACRGGFMHMFADTQAGTDEP